MQWNGGTSESAPLTAGVAALVIQAYAGTHGGAHPTPALVRQILLSTADDIGAPADQEGTGLVDAYQAVLAAASAPGSTVPTVGDAVLDSSPSLHADGAPGTTETLPETLTNAGSTPESLDLSSRTLGAYSLVSDTDLTVDSASANQATTTFTVPAGQARLDVSISYRPTDDGNVAAVYLFSPEHDYAGDSIAQGASGFADSQVTDPESGTWTAVVVGYPATDGGSLGSVELQARAADLDPVRDTLDVVALHRSRGQRLLRPDRPAPVHARRRGRLGGRVRRGRLRLHRDDKHPGDAAVGCAGSGSDHHVHRHGDRGERPGSEHRAGCVLRGRPARRPPGPQRRHHHAGHRRPDGGHASRSGHRRGCIDGHQQSPRVRGDGSTVAQAGAQLHVVSPDAGVWTLVVDFFDHVSGSALAAPFTVSLDTTPVPVNATGLPDDPTTTLAAGQPTTVNVSVANAGSTDEQFFADARTDSQVTIPLTAENHASDTLPDTTFDAPEYVVPPGTTSLTASVTSPAPVTTSAMWAFGDPSVGSVGAPSDDPSVTLSAPSIVPGTWVVPTALGGPFGRAAPTPVTIASAMEVTTQGFDSNMTCTSGDLWEQSTDPSAQFSPIDAPPGATADLPITIVPTRPTGTVVSGTLYIDVATSADGDYTDNGDSGPVASGSEVVALPYEYRIG